MGHGVAPRDSAAGQFGRCTGGGQCRLRFQRGQPVPPAVEKVSQDPLAQAALEYMASGANFMGRGWPHPVGRNAIKPRPRSSEGQKRITKNVWQRGMLAAPRAAVDFLFVDAPPGVLLVMVICCCRGGAVDPVRQLCGAPPL
ncbi:hypothetical protein DQ04_10631040 [Trypanosoma grayi]|uniref:hypothetical protein n=1 Tax=Trypanosoma grayi TaxID=71804 RepID=UPI0004F424A7|nr:hypothetical protein DQ04_10631040 [Trypanosoma grayi]KEG07185.1 hypothetical protein DQ04_10631040 [Trypanosoma grayi]